MHRFNDEITQTGELVAAEGLTHSSQGKTVQFTDGAVAVTDGPYGETTRGPGGLLDRRRRERGAGRSSWHRRSSTFTTEPLEIRRIGDAPPEM